MQKRLATSMLTLLLCSCSSDSVDSAQQWGLDDARDIGHEITHSEDLEGRDAHDDADSDAPVLDMDDAVTYHTSLYIGGYDRLTLSAQKHGQWRVSVHMSNPGRLDTAAPYPELVAPENMHVERILVCAGSCEAPDSNHYEELEARGSITWSLDYFSPIHIDVDLSATPSTREHEHLYLELKQRDIPVMF